MKRSCRKCGGEIVRRPNERPASWRKRTFCCRACTKGPRRDRDYAALFWAKVDKRGPNECWPWKGAALSKGYGMSWGLPFGMAYTAPSTHISIFLARGERVPKGAVVMHECDNPPCVNPEHLRVGTYTQNAIDAFARGLRPRIPPARNRWGHFTREQSS